MMKRKRVIMETLDAHGALSVDDLGRHIGANHTQTTRVLQALARDERVRLVYGEWTKTETSDNPAKGTL